MSIALERSLMVVNAKFMNEPTICQKKVRRKAMGWQQSGNYVELSQLISIYKIKQL